MDIDNLYTKIENLIGKRIFIVQDCDKYNRLAFCELKREFSFDASVYYSAVSFGKKIHTYFEFDLGDVLRIDKIALYDVTIPCIVLK